MAKGHKLHTERTNNGVMAECQGEGCNWSGKYTYQKSPVKMSELRTMTPEQKANIKLITVEDQVFPTRQLAVESHRQHHKGSDNG